MDFARNERGFCVGFAWNLILFSFMSEREGYKHHTDCTVVIVNFHGSVILPYCIKAKRCMGYWSRLALCLTKVRSSRARCPATALIEMMTLG